MTDEILERQMYENRERRGGGMGREGDPALPGGFAIACFPIGGQH